MRLLTINLRSQRAQRRAWGLGTLAYLLMIGLAYGSIVADAGADLDELWQTYPEEVRKLLGDAATITTIDGFMKAEAALFLAIALGIVPVLRMAAALAGAEEKGSLDHALSRPVTRQAYVVAQVGAAAALVGAILAGAGLGAFLGLWASGVSIVDALRAQTIFIELIPLALFFLGLGCLVGSLFHRRGQAATVGLSITTATFAMDILARFSTNLEWLVFLSPFGYYGRNDLYHGHLDIGYVVLVPAAAVLLGWVAIRAFGKKDLFA